MKSYVVIGLGRFGTELARRLCALGCEVMVIERNNELVQQVSQQVTHAVMGDARDLGVLKALGMNNGSLQRVFLYRAAFLVVRGMVWGNVAGIGLCLLQKWTHLLKLDASGYMLSEVPIALDWWWLVALNAGVLATIVLLLIVPARIVASVRPEEAMRYE